MIDFLLLANIVVTAFALSFSHCSFMCGGFCVIVGRLSADLSRLKQLYFVLLYHFGRIFAYCLLGFVFGSFGAGIVKNSSAKGLIFFICGAFLVFFGVALSVRGKLLAFFENSFIQSRILEFSLKLQKRPFIPLLGFLNGLLPCGVVYYFLALSFSAASGAISALIMLIAGLCTLPALLFYTFLSGILNVKFRQIAGTISSIIICIYGVYMMYKGYLLI